MKSEKTSPEEINQLWSSTEFPEQVSEIVSKHSMSYMDAVLHWCAERGYDPEVGGDMVRKYPSVKARIEKEAAELNFLKPEENKRARFKV